MERRLPILRNMRTASVLFTAVFASSLFVGCAPVDVRGSVNQVMDTVSGAQKNAANYLDTTVSGAKAIKNDVETRVKNVNDGIQKIKEGKDLIDQGLHLNENGDEENN